MIESGVESAVVDMLNSDDYEQKCTAVAIVTHLADCEANISTLCSSAIVSHMESLSTLQDPETMENISRFFRSVTATGVHTTEFALHPRIVDSLLLMIRPSLKKRTLQCKRFAMEALAKISTVARYQKQIKTSGKVGWVLVAFRSYDPAIRASAALVLRAVRKDAAAVTIQNIGETFIVSDGQFVKKPVLSSLYCTFNSLECRLLHSETTSIIL